MIGGKSTGRATNAGRDSDRKGDCGRTIAPLGEIGQQEVSTTQQFGCLRGPTTAANLPLPLAAWAVGSNAV